MIEGIFGKPGKDSPAGARILQLQQSLFTLIFFFPFGSQHEEKLVSAQLISVSFASQIFLKIPTNKQTNAKHLECISVLLPNQMLFLEKPCVYTTATSRVRGGCIWCPGEVSAGYRLTVVPLLKSLLPQKQILSKCKVASGHFLH